MTIRKCVRCGEERPVLRFVDEKDSWPVCSNECEDALRRIIASWYEPQPNEGLVDEKAPF